MNVISSRLLPFAFLLMIFTFMVSTSASAQFDGGDGTKEDPWQITTVEQLQSISDNLDAHFILTADIDASATADWNDGLGFEPIGDMDPRFTGSLDGNGYNISGLTIIRTGQNYVGLFGETHQATLQNVHLLDAEITGKNYVGGLAGSMSGGFIEHSSVTGFISGEDNVGGLTGSLYQGTIQGSYTAMSINGTRTVGGITGSMQISELVHSYSLSDVAGESTVGGLIGMIESVTSSNGDTEDEAGIVSGSFAAGRVDGEERTGGLIGEIIWVVLTKADLSGDETISDTSSILKSYWDIEATGQTRAVGTDERWEAFYIDTVGAKTLPMQQQSTYEGWDFDEIWAISEGQSYPWLQKLGMPVSNEPEPLHTDIPSSVELHQNYPNPFNPVTVIGYRLPVSGDVTLEVFDITGRRVATLVNGLQQAGQHQAAFDASGFASGIYFYRLHTGEQILTQKMTLIK